MTKRGTLNKLIAVLTLVSMQVLFLPVVADDSTAIVRGTVLSTSGDDPLIGALVHLGDPKTGTFYRSAPTDAGGGFEVSGLPAAEYRLAVEASGGLYVVPSAVTLTPGQSRSVQLAVNAQQGADPPSVEDEDDDQGGASFWSNPATATLTVLGIAIILGFAIDELVNDDDDTTDQDVSPAS